MTAVLALRDVGKTVGQPPRTLFTQLSFELEPGQSIALCGRSGSGKSTLLNLAGGMDLHYQGSITVDGQELRTLDDGARSALRRSTVGLVFQAFHLLDHVNILSNVLLPARFASAAQRAVATPRAKQLLEQVGLANRALEHPTILSGGERQRVAIARALLMSPRLILADEPTGNLDRATADGVLALFLDLVAQQHAALLLVTHDPAVAARMERTLWLKDGLLHGQAA